MWRIIYHNTGTLDYKFSTRQEAKDYLDEMVAEVTQGAIEFHYVDFPSMTDIVRNGEVIGAIVYVQN